MLAARPHRPGFTLAELLVVIAIIAVLGALVSAGVFKILEAIPKTTTTPELRSSCRRRPVRHRRLT